MASLIFRHPPGDPKKTLVHAPGYPIESPPIFTAVSSDKTHVLLYIGLGLGPQDIIGNSKMHHGLSGSRKFNLIMRGRPLAMKMDSSNYNLTIENSPVGKVKWKHNWMGKLAKMEVSGFEVASFGTDPMTQEKTLNIAPRNDHGFSVEVAVLSYMAYRVLKEKDKEMAEEVGEVLAEVLGAGA